MLTRSNIITEAHSLPTEMPERDSYQRQQNSGMNGNIPYDVYLHPGHLHVADKPQNILTILGSCVSVCLWDPVKKIGGINHYLLPRGDEDGRPSSRYGNHATDMVINKLEEMGCSKSRLLAKVFGGAHLLSKGSPRARHLGSQNVEVALEVLERERIKVVSMDVQGNKSRKLIFCVSDGAVWVKVF